MFKNLFYTKYTFFASVLLVWDANIVCVELTECVTQRSPGLLVTMLCQVSPSLNVANVHLVLLGTQAVLEGAQLPGGQLAHFWGQRHEGHIPTGTSVSAATQNTLFQMDDLCHQQHEITSRFT